PLNGELALALGGSAGIGHVAGDLGEALQPAIGGEGLAGRVGPEAGAILAHAPALVVRASSACGLTQDAFRPSRLDIFRGIEERDVLADHLAGLVALDPLRTLVPGQDVPIRPDQEDRIVQDSINQEANRLRSVGEVGEGALARGRGSLRRSDLRDSHKQPQRCGWHSCKVHATARVTDAPPADSGSAGWGFSPARTGVASRTRWLRRQGRRRLGRRLAKGWTDR